jgi:GntR family transcriptional regulator
MGKMGPGLSFQFEIHPSSGVPIYRQLMDQIRLLIASGRLSSGDLVPSVRQMAEELQINLMTVSKA